MLDHDPQILKQNTLLPRFSDELEDRFQQYQYTDHIPRIRLLAYTAIGMMLFYSCMDWYLLSHAVTRYTLAIRLGLDIPVIMLTLWASYRCSSHVMFNRIYVSAYAFNGLSIVGILYICRLHDIHLPYEGLFLWLMFGYFLLALPYIHAIWVTWSLTLLYLFMEWHVGLSEEQLHYNSYFLISANIVGTVGVYLLEHLARMNFLHLKQTEVAKEQAMQDVEKRTRFIAAASHDLRQPIHAMGLMIHRLQKHPTEIHTTAPQLQEAHDQLNELLNSLLDISKLDVGLIQPQLEPVQLCRLVSCLPQHKQLHVQLDQHLWVQADAVLLIRIVSNLVTNAIRHASASRIEVGAEQHEGTTRLWVKDDGIGISESQQKRLFMPFQRGQGSQQGLGLGLAIVKELCDLMGLSLKLNTAAGAGCEFSIELISAPAQLALPINTQSCYQQTTTKTSKITKAVLIQCAEKQAIKTLVASWGYEVTEDEPSCGDQLLGIIGDQAAIERFRSRYAALPALMIAQEDSEALSAFCQQADIHLMAQPLTPVSIKIWLERIPDQSAVA